MWRFPNDPTLRSLPDLVWPRSRRSDLPSAVAEALPPGPEPLHVTVVRYQPVTGGTGEQGPAVFGKHPPVRGRVAALVGTATRRRDAARPGRRCTHHGDFHLDQLVSSEAGPVLVDLESMMTGPPETDLAEFLVDLALRGLPAPITARVGEELLASYAAAAGTGVDVAALGLCADAEFLNRCYRHLRRHTHGWEVDLEEELTRYDEVRRLLGG